MKNWNKPFITILDYENLYKSIRVSACSSFGDGRSIRW